MIRINNIKKMAAAVLIGFMILSGPAAALVFASGSAVQEKAAGLKHPAFVTRRDFQDMLAAREMSHFKTSRRIIAAVVPHHLLASRLIIDLFTPLAAQKPDVIVLIGPNHANRGGKIITGLNGWQTPEGTVRTDPGIVGLLLRSGAAVCDEKTLDHEHSMGNIMPFIRHTLPNTRVVPIILQGSIGLKETEKLMNVLEPALNRHTVLVASVDFSHYLPAREAAQKDAVTLGVMKNFDDALFFRLNNDYLDSPASLAAPFILAKKHGVGQFTLLANTNSGYMSGSQETATTSYFTLLFMDNGSEGRSRKTLDSRLTEQK